MKKFVVLGKKIHNRKKFTLLRNLKIINVNLMGYHFVV